VPAERLTGLTDSRSAKMLADRIEYVELYTPDLESALEYYVSGFGFSVAASCEAPGHHSVLLRQGGAQIVLTTGPDTEDFCAPHGDGIADIAFGCEELAGTEDGTAPEWTVSLLSGHSRISVAGFGDVRHTLLPRRGKEEQETEYGHTWNAWPESYPATGRSAPIQKIDHVAVCVNAGALNSLARSYIDRFGFKPFYSEYISVGEQAMNSVVVGSPAGGITLTILEPDPGKKPGQIDEFLLRHGGPGVQHVAFLVDELVPAVREYQPRVEFMEAPQGYYDHLIERIPGMSDEIADLREAGALADRDEWGYLLQLFTRSPYPRGTLFYELIERRGARGFGSANIRALYESVERDRAIR
jgi:4-hydroxymandelate synthase